MKKLLLSLVMGERYQREYAHLMPLRRRWAERHGWELAEISCVPEAFVARHARKDRGFGYVCNLYKLQLPGELLGYDLVAAVDTDVALNPSAPCLSEYVEAIPAQGFCAVQTESQEDRALFPGWSRTYYDDLVARGWSKPVGRPDTHINGGLLVYRPRDVSERWRALLEIPGSLNEENRLNVSEVQDGRCFLLEGRWNVLWMYERIRLGADRYRSRSVRAIKRLVQPLMRYREAPMVNAALRRSHALHLAFEHSKVFWVDPDVFVGRARSVSDEKR